MSTPISGSTAPSQSTNNQTTTNENNISKNTFKIANNAAAIQSNFDSIERLESMYDISFLYNTADIEIVSSYAVDSDDPNDTNKIQAKKETFYLEIKSDNITVKSLASGYTDVQFAYPFTIKIKVDVVNNTELFETYYIVTNKLVDNESMNDSEENIRLTLISGSIYSINDNTTSLPSYISSANSFFVSSTSVVTRLSTGGTSSNGNSSRTLLFYLFVQPMAEHKAIFNRTTSDGDC